LSKKVIIIGAGVAGLTAASHLVKSGFDVHIFEARKSIGGRLFSISHTDSGEVIDNGQHLISGAYTEFMSLLNELGTSTYLKSSDGLNVHYAQQDGKQYLLAPTGFAGDLGFIAGLFKFDALSLTSKFQLISFFVKLKLKRIASADFSCYDLLKNEHQGDEVISVFWEPLILAVMNARPKHIAATLLIEVLERAFFAGGAASNLLLPTCELSALLQPFENWFARNGGDLHFRSPVKNILVDNGKAIGIVLHNGEKIYSDRVISTVQAPVLYKMLPSDFQKNDFNFLMQFNYSTIINIYLWLDKHIQTPDFTAMLGTKSQWLFNRRNFISSPNSIITKYPGMLNITISGADELAKMPPTQLATECFDEIINCFPKFAGVELRHSKVLKDRFATFAATTETERLRPEPITSIKNLLLAGDWTNTGLPATIESAAISGKKAAQIISNNNTSVTGV